MSRYDQCRADCTTDCGTCKGSPPAEVIQRDAIVTILDEHTIECTGLGEVTCRGCRERRWMPWGTYLRHIADLIVAETRAVPR